jgi:SPP1 gp7 family putative phage head morphogenesis protein
MATKKTTPAKLAEKPVPAESSGPVFRELAAVRSGYEIASLLGLGESNPDTRIQELGIEYFEQEMELKDGHYRGDLGARKRALLRRGYAILPASEDPLDVKIAEHIKWNFANIEGTFTQDLRELLSAISDGFAASEEMWELVEGGEWAGTVRLKALHNKPPAIFDFKTDEFGNLKPDGFRVKPTSGISTSTPVSREKFVHFVFDSKYENPYGRGLGSPCSWYVWFKKNTAKFMLIFLERFGTPGLCIELPANPTAEDIARVDQALAAWQQATGMRVPKDAVPKLIEATRRGEAGYIEFMDWCDRQVSELVRGETMTAGPSANETGSYGRAQVAADVKVETIDEDGEDLSECIQEQAVKRLVDYNYITERYPKFVFLTPKVAAELTPEMMKLLLERGLAVGANWAYEHFGIDQPAEGEETLATGVQQGAPVSPTQFPPAEAAFAEGRHPRETIEFTQRMGEQVEALTLEGGLALSKALRAYRDALLTAIQTADLIDQKAPDRLATVTAGLTKDGIAEPLVSGLVTGALLGRADAYTELRAGGWKPAKQTLSERLRHWIGFRESYRGLVKLLTPNGAHEYFAKRVPVSSAAYAEMEAWAKARAFAVAEVEASELAKIVQGHLLEAIDNGWAFEQFRFAVMSDPKLQDRAPIREASTGHLETIFRTNLMSAYNEGSWNFYQDPDVAEDIVAYEYVAILDSRTREDHAAMDGQVFLKDDPIWNQWWPPNGYNCRCKAVGVTKYDDLRLAPKVPVIDGKQVEPDQGFGGTARGFKVRGEA